MYQLYKDRPLIILCIICANIVLSLWCINSDPIINNDAVTYLAIAQKLVDGYWNETFTYYSWPFYSILIAATANLFSLEVITAAYVANTLFAALISLAFVSIVRELSNNNRAIILIATLIIIFFPSINKYRSFIIRDFGYLACYLWSLYFLVRYSSNLNKTHLAGWLACALLSCLFRFEGIIFLLAIPYFLLLLAAKRIPNKRIVLISLSIVIAIIFMALAFWYLNDKYTALISIAKVTGEDVNGLRDLFFANINQNSDGESMSAMSYIWLFFGNVGDVFYQLLRRMSIIYFLLAGYAYVNRLSLKNLLLKRIWIIYVLINLLILISFSFYNHFIVSRYTLATSLTLLLIVPFAINTLILKAKNSNNLVKAMTLFVGFLLAVEAIDKLNIENKKAYIKTSGAWISRHVAQDATIYSNNKLVIYYADRGPDSNLNDLYGFNMLIRNLDYKKLQNYDFVAYSTISSFKLDTMVTNRLSKEYGDVVKKIYGYGEQAIFIYQRR